MQVHFLFAFFSKDSLFPNDFKKPQGNIIFGQIRKARTSDMNYLFLAT